MGEYRVVRADGSLPFEWPMTLREAQEQVRSLNNTAIVGPASPGPYRVQRMVWEDVPEPEPLPDDLPTEVLMVRLSNGDWIRVLDVTKGHRTFQGRITEWVEVTE